MDLSTAVERLGAALTAEYELTLKTIEAGHSGDLGAPIQARIDDLFLTEDGWDGDAPFSAFQTSLRPPTTVAFQAKALKKLGQRTLFKAERYAAEDVGGIARLYVSEPKKNQAATPFFALDLALVGGDPKIVATHELCGACRGSGLRDGAACDAVDFGGFPCVKGLKFKGGLSFDAGERLESARHAEAAPGWEALMER